MHKVFLSAHFIVCADGSSVSFNTPEKGGTLSILDLARMGTFFARTYPALAPGRVRPGARAGRRAMIMGRFLPIHSAILVKDSDGRTITGTGSVHDLVKTRTLAQSILPITPEALYCDLHLSLDDWSYQPNPVEIVSLDQEGYS